MTVKEESVQHHSAIGDENPLFRANSPQGQEKLAMVTTNGFIEDDLEDMSSLKPSKGGLVASPLLLSSHHSSFPHTFSHKPLKPPRSPPPPPPTSSSSPPPSPPAEVVPDPLGIPSSAVSTISSIEDEVEKASHSINSGQQRSIPSITSLEDDFGYFTDTPKILPPIPFRPKNNNHRFQSLITHTTPVGVPIKAPGLLSLPPNPDKIKLKDHHFPRYRRQYKVESIYVNDLYTLTYDQGETLENVKSVVVNYRRNDREEIRRRLAMGADDDQSMERPHRKPSLHSRLQSGMNLQICFMNETASDCESQCSDTESTQDREVDTDHASATSANSKASTPQPTRTRTATSEPDVKDVPLDFFTRQAQLQAEARMALAQAKEMARMQMEIEKQSKKKSPIAEIVRESFNKIGVPFPDSKRRISRQILTDMNVAQLQVIVNDLHTQIESLNEDLVTFLMERDDLHMEQDSMLVDIEDLTKHIGAKELSLRGQVEGQDIPKITLLSTPPSRSKSSTSRYKSIVKK